MTLRISVNTRNTPTGFFPLLNLTLVWFILSILLCSPRVQAIEGVPGGFDEDMFFGEMPVVLSVTRLEQPASQAPASVTTIDKEMIHASGVVDLADIFRLVPGFLVGSEKGWQRTVGYLGLQDAFSRRIQVLIDGRSVYSPFFGGVLWSDLPLAIDDIQRIEVIRGPNAVTYGANAFLAVINIITEFAAETEGRHLKYVKGNNDVQLAQYRQGGRYGNLNYRFTLQYEEDQGFENWLNKINDDKRLGLFTLRVDNQLNARDYLSIQAGIKAGVLGTGEIGNPLTPSTEAYIRRYFLSTKWRRVLGDENELSLLFSINHNNYESRWPVDTSSLLGLPSVMDVDLSQYSERYDLELEQQLRLTENLRGVWGSELRYERVSGPTLLNATHENHLVRVFGNMEWQALENTLVNIGAMIEENSLVSPEISPRLGINHTLAPGHTLRMSVSRATRSPSVFEAHADYYSYVTDPSGSVNFALFQDFRVEGSVQAEEIVAYEIGYLFESKKNHLSADLKLYHYEVDNLLRAYNNSFLARPEMPGVFNVNGPGISRNYNNDDSAELEGVELQLNFRPNSKTRLSSFLSLSNIRSRRNSTIGALETPAQIRADVLDWDLSGPENKFSLMVIHRPIPSVELSALYQTTSNFSFQAGGQTGGYDVFELRAAKKMNLGPGAEGELSLTLQGLAGEYIEFNNENIHPKQVLMGLSLAFD